jgi:DNA-binding NtrC family response regulator
MVKTGQFRQDLYFRISTFPIAIPPLRERREDLPLLIRSLLERIAPRRELELSPEALACLMSYSFPGNIRELRNMLERASILADGKRILPEHLPDAYSDEKPLAAATSMPFGEVVSLEDMEKRYLRWALARLPSSRRQQAHALGVSERTLFRKIESLGEND